MFIKQVSVFLENREGRLQAALEVIKDANINIQSLSLADSGEFGSLRLIVNKPDEALASLKAAGYSAYLTDVAVIKLPNVEGALQGAISALTSENISVEYLYALSITSGLACIVIKPTDIDKCAEALKNKKLELLSNEELLKM